MSEAYVGEIRCFGFTFAPYQWALCNGQLTAISQNTVLFSLLGTNFGGNGTTTFGLPNLQGQVPMHWGTAPGFQPTVCGQFQGETSVGLTQQNMLQHQHAIYAAQVATGAERSATPKSTSYISEAKGSFVYQAPTATPNTAFSQKAIAVNGGSQPHENMQPYQVLSFCISLYGVFPPRG
jgi:microcystin-dependent protein